jgi:hypothetical protein
MQIDDSCRFWTNKITMIYTANREPRHVVEPVNDVALQRGPHDQKHVRSD